MNVLAVLADVLAEAAGALGSAPAGLVVLVLLWGETRLLPAVRAVVRLESESQDVLVGLGRKAGVDVSRLEAALVDARRAVPS